MASDLTPDIPLSATLGPVLTADETSPRAALDRIAGMNFRFVQLSSTHSGLRPRDLDKAVRRDLLATLRRAQLTLSGLDAWIPLTHFTDPQHVDRAVSAVLGAIELAADLGRVPVSLTLPPQPEIVSLFVERADRFGVVLADHSLPTAPPKADERIGVGIDPPALLASNADPASAVSAQASRLVSARLSDLLTSGMRAPIGNKLQGRLDVLSYKVALSVASYRRPVIADARQWTDPWQGLEQSQRAWAAPA